MKIVYSVIAFMALQTLFASQPPDTFRQCRTHVDPVLHVEFPTYFGGLSMASRTTYRTGEYDYSIRYNSEESADLGYGGRHLDIYVFTRDDKEMSDGVNEKVMKELEGASEGIKLRGEQGYYSKLKMLDMSIEGTLARSRLKYMWFSSTMKFQDRGKSHMSITLIFAWRNRFIKLRYSEPILNARIEPCESLPESVLEILRKLDWLIVKAEEASNVDVYSMKNPKDALEALRQKWLGIEDRISPYDMPDYAERFFELDQIQDWCAEDIEKRAGVFADVALEGIRLKIEPPIWYYNYACALSRMEKKEEAVQALEQAVVSGYNDADHMIEDADMNLLRDDPRFKKLMAMCGEIKNGWRSPKEHASIEADTIQLNESNIYWGFNDASYMVEVDGATSNTLIYLDHNARHRYHPAGNVVSAEYSEELQDLGRTCGAANFNFINPLTGRNIPTLLACSAVYRDDRTNCVQSIPARFWQDGDSSRDEERHLYMNVLGVYRAGTDYAYDGVDRFFGWDPVSLVYYDETDADDLVRVCIDAWNAMKPEVREKGGIRQLLGVVRRGQKCVKSEKDFISAEAQRPAFSIEDIDVSKVIELASRLDKPYPEMPVIASASMGFEMTPVTDLWNAPYNQPIACRSVHHAVYVARWAEKTGKFLITIPSDKGRLEWRTLQGNESKVKFTKREPVEEDGKVYEVMEIESEYQEAFEVVLPNGEKMLSTRVDVGCFRVVDGVYSMPAIISVYYMPSEERVYGDDGLLESIDYTRPQISAWRPWFCPNANFKDLFHWTKDGKCTGWTRINSEGRRTEFTRDGLVVMTRDSFGRPKDVRRSLNMDWLQRIKPVGTTGEEYSVQHLELSVQYDRNEGPPQETTLSWQYSYENDEDIWGKPSPKEPVKFSPRPELCCRANFSKESGFKLPLISQMMLGAGMYSKYKCDCFDNEAPSWELPNDYLRSDSSYALKKSHLFPPEQLRKMQFCSWTPSTNDLWQIDMAEHEEWSSERLYELADGVYRSYRPPENDNESGAFASVGETYASCNLAAEADAYMKLDEKYRRCNKREVRKVLANCFSDNDWRVMLIVENEPLFNDLPKGVSKVLGMWHLTEDMYIGILANHDTGYKVRVYFFVVVDENNTILTYDYFDELPSRAIGNALLGAYADNAEALNNFAVLFYCGIANPKSYNEESVVTLLRRAGRRGCSAAIYNLGVLYFNRGENELAETYFQRAKDRGYVVPVDGAK